MTPDSAVANLSRRQALATSPPSRPPVYSAPDKKTRQIVLCRIRYHHLINPSLYPSSPPKLHCISSCCTVHLACLISRPKRHSDPAGDNGLLKCHRVRAPDIREVLNDAGTPAFTALNTTEVARGRSRATSKHTGTGYFPYIGVAIQGFHHFGANDRYWQ